MVETLSVGTVRYGWEVGKRPEKSRFVYCTCETCGIGRFVYISHYYNGNQLQCNHCAAAERAATKRTGCVGEPRDAPLTYAKHDSCKHFYINEWDSISCKPEKVCLYCGDVRSK